MGQVIEGPWMRRDLPALMSELDEELRRMIVVLERAREHYARETAHAAQSHAHRETDQETDQETDFAGLRGVQPRIGAES